MFQSTLFSFNLWPFCSLSTHHLLCSLCAVAVALPPTRCRSQNWYITSPPLHFGKRHNISSLLSNVMFLCALTRSQLSFCYKSVFAFLFLIFLFFFHFSQQTHQRRDEPFGEVLQVASTIGDLRNCPVSGFLVYKLSNPCCIQTK